MNQMFSEGLDINYGILYGLGKCMDTDLVIPEGVTKIVKSFGNSQGLNRIKSIVFPSTLKDIEIDVINKCNGLVRAVFKDGFIYSRAYLFSGLQNLEEVILPKTMKDILYDTFRNCKKLRRVVVPDGVTSIGKSAFKGCKNLVELDLPNSIKKLESNAFDGCNLLKINEEHLIYVGKWVIGCDKSVNYVKVKDGTIGIASLVFNECNNLKTIELPNSLKYICEGAFENCKSLESLDLPTDFLAIAENALYGCESIKRITMPILDLKCIGKLFGVHYDGLENERYLPKSLKQVVLNSGKVIPKSLFIGSKYLEEVILPENLEEIGESAFMSCKNIKSIKIPEGVLEIKARAFFDCSNLEEVIFSKVLPNIGTSAFYNTKVVINKN